MFYRLAILCVFVWLSQYLTAVSCSEIEWEPASVLIEAPCQGLERVGESSFDQLDLVAGKKKQRQARTSQDLFEAKCKYELSICAIFQQEGRFLKEWIEYHQLVGVQHFYLFNNNSRDNYLEVLQPYIALGTVELIDWPSPLDANPSPYQYQAYNHCVHQLALGVTKWLALIDIDEFLVPLQYNTVNEVLREHEQYASMLVFWHCFGTSYLDKIPANKLMTECLVRAHPPLSGGQTTLWKSIIKPHRIQYVNIHDCYSPSHEACAANPGFDPSWIALSRIAGHPQMRINHYVTKDEEFLCTIKRERRERYEGSIWSDEILEGYKNMYNDVEDYAIFRFIPELRRRVFGG